MAYFFECEQYYHLYNHAVGDENLFREDDNYRYFLKQFAFYILPIAEVYAYCLMPNHFHLLIRIRDTKEIEVYRAARLKSLGKPSKGSEPFEGLSISKWISQQFGHLFNAYTQAYNKKYNRRGTLLCRSVKRKPITNEHYLTACIRYLHMNPIHHGFVASLESWKWSSYQALLSLHETQLSRETALSWFGNMENYIAVHHQRLDDTLMAEMEMF